MGDLVRRHETGVFLALTFGLAWALWLLSGVLGRSDPRAPDWRWAVAQVGVFAPAFAGLVVATCVEPGAGRRALRTLLCVYLPATLLAFSVGAQGHASFADVGPGWILAIGALGAWASFWFARRANQLVRWPGERSSSTTVALWALGALVVPGLLFVPCWLGAAPSASMPPDIPAVVRELTPFGIASALAVNLSFGGSLGEEPGWRGVWLPRLLRTERPVGASLTMGVAWALWHAPIDLSQGFGVTGVFALVARLLWTLPLTLVFTWVTVRAGGSVLPALALHTGINTIPDFAMRDPGRYERAMGLYVVLMLVLGLAIALHDRRLWRPVAAAFVTFGLLFGAPGAFAHASATSPALLSGATRGAPSCQIPARALPSSGARTASSSSRPHPCRPATLTPCHHTLCRQCATCDTLGT